MPRLFSLFAHISLDRGVGRVSDFGSDLMTFSLFSGGSFCGDAGHSIRR